jgi:mevalonate kinase
MLLGEHAVLHGHRAMVCAINRRITVRLTPAPEDTVKIVSDLGEYESPLMDLVDHPSFLFVLQAIRQQIDHLPAGFELKISSEFSSDIGFGSSAAVTVATQGALMQWIMGEAPQSETLFAQSLKTVRAVQGGGSGADLAASVYGGIVGYRSGKAFSSFGVSVPLTAVYCGYKTPTAEVIAQVNDRFNEHPEKFERIYNEIDQGVEEAVHHLQNHDLPAFGRILDHHQLLMNEMGVNTSELEEIVAALQADPDIFGAKISGSGLGDCAVGVGYTDLTGSVYPVHHLEISTTGYE